MINRRNIRIKVMQCLYTLERQTDSAGPKTEPVALLKKQMEYSRQLLVYLIYTLTEIARYVEKDAAKRASKHLPSEADLNINTRLAGNTLLWTILEAPTFVGSVNELHPEKHMDDEIIRELYHELVNSDEYRDYLALPAREKHQEKAILEFIFTQLMLPSETFTNHLEEQFLSWNDDAEMMSQLVLQYLNKPLQMNLNEIVGKDKWTYSRDLLETTINKADVTLELIKPKLKNWDADRIAVLDMLLIRMGICEFLYFETIPTKVTINEYIDLAKSYSTPQSGQFVNGILDNIHKDLMQQGRIQKKSFRNSTL